MDVNMNPLLIQDKKKIIEYALNNIPFDGWTMRMLHAAFKSADISSELLELYFPDGLYSLLIEIIDQFNNEMIKIINRDALSSMRTRDRIIYLVKTRINIASKHKEVIRTGISMFLCPNMITDTTSLLWSNADDIWSLAGDKSLDFNYYTKRGFLGIIYAQTLMFWLEDKSEDNFLTWRYLEERVEWAIRMGGIKTKINNVIEKINVKNIPLLRYIYAINVKL